MTAFYNEIDPYAAEWLRRLIDAGLIARGEVSETSITDLDPDYLKRFKQCHFFAGIGVWSFALRQSGWSDSDEVWTGSCPCQPFSAAGQKKGFDDERHLWPAWHRLIRECRPSKVLGEQVASALDWVDLVSTDLEREDYAFGAADICAAGFGGAHLRQRLYFVGLAHSQHTGSQGQRGSDRLAGETQSRHGSDASRHGPTCGDDGYEWIEYSGKKYPVRPGTRPLVDAPPGRVGRLRAYGNALDAGAATAFCAAVRALVFDFEDPQPTSRFAICDLVA